MNSQKKEKLSNIPVPVEPIPEKVIPMNNIMRARADLRWAQNAPGCNSKRSSAYIEGIYPQFINKGHHCYIYDVDNRQYIDFTGALGAVSLGYNHPKVMEAIIKQLKNGIICGPLTTDIEVECYDKICSTFALEKVRFLKSGNEATNAAIRIARAFTHRSHVVSEGYHGHGDMWTSLTPPAIGVVDKFDISASSDGNDAAYIFEGLLLSDEQGDIDKLKAKIKEYKLNHTVTISDEIVTGCRVENWTANQKYDYKADLVCLGKGIANGMPLSVVGGDAYIMDSTEYFVSSTYSGETLSLAACIATLDEIKTKSLKDLQFYAKRFLDNLNNLIKPINVKIQGYGTRGMFPSTQIEGAIFMQECCKVGLFFGKAFFYNFAHMETEGLEETVMNKVSDVVAKIKRGDAKLEGRLPAETFRR